MNSTEYHNMAMETYGKIIRLINKTKIKPQLIYDEGHGLSIWFENIRKNYQEGEDNPELYTLVVTETSVSILKVDTWSEKYRVIRNIKAKDYFGHDIGIKIFKAASEKLSNKESYKKAQNHIKVQKEIDYLFEGGR